MRNKPTSIVQLALMTSMFTCQFSHPQPESSFPTHCKPNEFAYLNARMARIEYRDEADRDLGYSLKKNGKVLSLCADQQNEPFGKLVYRYGEIGKVELESVATASSRFEIFSRSTSPHTGENVISFSRGKFTYYITEAIGQGSGISLYVFKSGQRVLDLFSGTEEGIDYQSELIEMNFEKSSSPIFLVSPPKDNLSQAAPTPIAPVGLFIGAIEEGARIFTPVRLLPFEHPDADAHEFPNALQLHHNEYEALVWLGQHVSLQLAATLQRYPRPPVQQWWYEEFEELPFEEIKAAPVHRMPASASPIPGLKAVVYDEGQAICFIVDTRGLTLEERGMGRPTTMGLDLTRAEFLAGLAEVGRSVKGERITIAVIEE